MLCNSDSKEQEGYAVLLCDDNFENDLDAAKADTKIKADQLHSGYVYSDINNERQDPISKLLSAINNIKSKTIVANNITVRTITHHSKGHFILLNDWEDIFYLHAVFPTLFLFEDDRNLRKRQQLVSIEAWTKWILQYHSHW